jgi:hypothetical protein
VAKLVQDEYVEKLSFALQLGHDRDDMTIHEE